MTFTILIATSGRPTLRQTLDSLKGQLTADDEVVLVSDGVNDLAAKYWQEARLRGRFIEIDGPHNDWGHVVRNRFQGQFNTDYVLHMDDDDIYLPWALGTIRHYVAQNPGKAHVFRTYFADDAKSIWSEQGKLVFGNATTVNFAIPRQEKYATWPPVVGGDFYFLQEQYKGREQEIVWVDAYTTVSRPHLIQEPLEKLVLRLAGQWTAHNIMAGPFQTLQENDDSLKLQRLLQLVSKLAPEARSALDLAALEGQYSFALAARGCSVTAVEGRQLNVIKLEAAKWLLLRNHHPEARRVGIVQRDARELGAEDFSGPWHLTLCLGLLYHFTAQQVLPFLINLRKATAKLSIIDTHICLPEESSAIVTIAGDVYAGKTFREFPVGTPEADVEKMHWSSIGNATSFWFTKESLLRLLALAGFSTVLEVHEPHAPQPADRVVLACHP